MLPLWLAGSAFDLAMDASRAEIQWLIYVFPLPRMVDFTSGIILGLVFERSRVAICARSATILEVVSIALVALGIAISIRLPPAYGFASCMLPAWALLIFMFALRAGKLSDVLCARPCIVLGEISFAFYMVHHLVTDRVTGIAALAASVAIAAGVHYFFEVPLRSAMRRRCKSESIRRRLYAIRLAPPPVGDRADSS